MNVHLWLRLKPRSVAAIIAAACVASALHATAQDKPAPPETSAPAAAPANPAAFTYDVVSIKPVNVGMSFTMSANFTVDGLTFRAFTVGDFLRNAFIISIPDQLVGLPDWANRSGGEAAIVSTLTQRWMKRPLPRTRTSPDNSSRTPGKQ
jgi:hypothetical protein